MSSTEKKPAPSGAGGLADVPTPAGAPESHLLVPDAASDPGPAAMRGWLWIAYPLALIGVASIWGSVLSILLGRQVAAIVPGAQASAGALGIVVSISSIVALVSQPVMGRISDITRIRVLGRRNFWVLIGGLLSGAALIVTGSSSNLVVLAVAWAVALIPISMVQAALTAVLPERVPLARRGTMSGIVGMSTIIGGLIGSVVAGLAGSIAVAYTIVATFVVLMSALFALSTKDSPAPVVSARIAGTKAPAAKLPGFRAYPDFWWTFIGRFTLLLGYFFFSTFGLYMLRDYIHVGDGSIAAAAAAIVPATGLTALLTLVFALVGGLLVDKFGKVRIFVAIASAFFVPAALVLVISPTYPAYLIASAILGAAFGVYVSVDQVLITRVIPSTANAGRDLGILNIANSGPQVLAPAIAGAIIAATGNYQILFVVMIVLVALATISVRFIKSVP